jgi:uncharacterized protein (TIGR01244 family)
MTMLRAFLIAIAVAMVGVVGLAALNREPPPRVRPAPVAHPLGEGIKVREQVTLDDVARLGGEGYRTVIDLRPDGEVAGQPASTAVGEVARSAGMSFAYIPTPHGTIPDETVAEFSRVLADAPRPVMLYCRSGKRAARVWALAEAARSGGPTADSIAKIVSQAGQPVDDILPRIAARVASRTAAP